MNARSRQRALVIALLASMLLWQLPFGGFLLYPFKLLATWMHEMSHGLVMLVTGAGFKELEIYRDTSGIAFADARVGQAARAAIASAGYLGTALFGGVLLVLGQSQRAARSILVILGLLLALSAALWVRNRFGVGAVVVGAIASLLIAALSRESSARLVVNFIAAQACINAVLDIRVLLRPELVINGEIVVKSDAHNMAAASFGTPNLWAFVWLGWSFAVFFVALRIIYRREKRERERTDAAAESAAPGK